MGIENLIPDLAKLLGVDPSTALLLFGLLIFVSNVVGRVIPDDAVGALGVVRKIAKVLGGYTPNRITAGVSVSDVASRVIAGHVSEFASDVIDELADDEHALIPEIVKAFPNLPASGESVDDIINKTTRRLRDSNGQFTKGE